MNSKCLLILTPILVLCIILVSCGGAKIKPDIGGQQITKKEFILKYSRWPVWRDVPIETKDYDRIWKTIIDILAEEYPLDVMDVNSGYVRTSWSHIYNIKSREPLQRRYTVRIYPKEGRVRIGLDIRVIGGSESIVDIHTAWRIGPEKLWGDQPQEIRNRLREIR